MRRMATIGLRARLQPGGSGVWTPALRNEDGRYGDGAGPSTVSLKDVPDRSRSVTTAASFSTAAPQCSTPAIPGTVPASRWQPLCAATGSHQFLHRRAAWGSPTNSRASDRTAARNTGMLANGFSKTGATPRALELKGNSRPVAAFELSERGKIRGPWKYPLIDDTREVAARRRQAAGHRADWAVFSSRSTANPLARATATADW